MHYNNLLNDDEKFLQTEFFIYYVNLNYTRIKKIKDFN